MYNRQFEVAKLLAQHGARMDKLGMVTAPSYSSLDAATVRGEGLRAGFVSGVAAHTRHVQREHWSERQRDPVGRVSAYCDLMASVPERQQCFLS